MNANKKIFVIFINLIVLSFIFVPFISLHAVEIKYGYFSDGQGAMCETYITGTNQCQTYYFCTEHGKADPSSGTENSNYLINECKAGISKILSNFYNITRNKKNYRITQWKLDAFIHFACNKSTYGRNIGVNIYINDDNYKDALKAYATVEDINNNPIKYDTTELKFNDSGVTSVKVSYDTNVNMSYNSTTKTYKDALYKATCSLTNGRFSDNKKEKVGINSGTKLTIKAEQLNKEVTLTCRLYYKYDNIHYYAASNSYQDFVSRDTENKHTSYGAEKSSSGKYTKDSYLKIKKIDASTGKEVKTGSAYFNIYKGKGCKGAAFKSNIEVNGHISIKIEPNTYSIKEIKAPDGYKAPEPNNCIDFTVDSGKTKTISIENKKDGELVIKKVDNNSNLIAGTAFFNIYNGYDCTGSIYAYDIEVNGKKSIGAMAKGKYSIKEIHAPSGYETPNSNNCKNFDIKLGETTTIQIKNSKTCESKLKKINEDYKELNLNRKKQLLELFNEFPNYTKLLDFRPDYSACEVATCSNNLLTSCLKSEFNPDSSFNENNLSCYTDTIEADSKTGYCLTKFDLDSTEEYKKYIEENPITFSGQLYFNVSNGILLTGKFNQTCYFVDKITSSTISKNKTISNYISGLKMTGITLSNGKIVNLNIVNDEKINLKGSGTKYIYNKEDVEYEINPVWSEFEGDSIKEQCDDKNCRLLGYGIISQLNETGQDDFKYELTFNTEKYKKTASATCSYYSERRLPDLEFRLVDTDKPFANKEVTGTDNENRNTMTNWCYDTNKIVNLKDIIDVTKTQKYLENLTSEGKELYKDGIINSFDTLAGQYYLANHKTSSCAYDNILVRYYIQGKTNSFNTKYEINSNLILGNKVTGDGPKYKIVLTPQLMKDIAKGTDAEIAKMNLQYDKFYLDCDDNNICTSKLLTYLKETKGVLKINYSTKR